MVSCALNIEFSGFLTVFWMRPALGYNISELETKFQLLSLTMHPVEFCLEVVYFIYNNAILLTIVSFVTIVLSLPVLFFTAAYVTSLFIGIHGFIHGLKDPKPSNRDWDTTRRMAMTGWHRFGKIWHGYEVEGLENIPDKGPALLVSYHSAASYDLYLFTSAVYLLRNRLIRMVGEKILYIVPGLGFVLRAFGSVPGPVSACVDILNEGDLFLIAPGGAYETLFGDTSYTLKWRNRVGYAKVAIQAKTSIIPVFTINCGEITRTGFKSITHPLYMLTKFPWTPMYGIYPVKLKTIIGKPIPYDPNVTVEELAAKTRLALENIIKEHQRLPGSIFQALLDRVRTPDTKKSA